MFFGELLPENRNLYKASSDWNNPVINEGIDRSNVSLCAERSISTILPDISKCVRSADEIQREAL